MYLFLLLCMFLSVSSTKHLRTKPKFCVNCKHFIPSTGDSSKDELYAKCAMFPHQNSSDYLVTGKNIYDSYFFCSTARSWSDMCGPDAKKYKKKYKTRKTKKNETSNELPRT